MPTKSMVPIDIATLPALSGRFRDIVMSPTFRLAPLAVASITPWAASASAFAFGEGTSRWTPRKKVSVPASSKTYSQSTEEGECTLLRRLTDSAIPQQTAGCATSSSASTVPLAEDIPCGRR